MHDQLRAELQHHSASLVGFADMRVIPAEVRGGMPFAVSIAVALDPGVVSGIGDGPTEEYWAEYKRANAVLQDLGSRTAAFLEARGQRAKWLAPTIVSNDPVTHSGVSYDPETLSTKLPHKTAATLAGLGWIGKCALLVTRQFGPAVRLTTVLTDASLSSGKPVEDSACGGCSTCVDACPAHALLGRNWHSGLDRSNLADVFACRVVAHQRAKTRIGIDETICGICIAVCPWTQKYLHKATV